MALCDWMIFVQCLGLDFPALEDKTRTLIWNVGHPSPSDALQHARRMDTPTTAVQKPKNMQASCYGVLGYDYM
jgi:hypothetical protein